MQCPKSQCSWIMKVLNRSQDRLTGRLITATRDFNKFLQRANFMVIDIIVNNKNMCPSPLVPSKLLHLIYFETQFPLLKRLIISLAWQYIGSWLSLHNENLQLLYRHRMKYEGISNRNLMLLLGKPGIWCTMIIWCTNFTHNNFTINRISFIKSLVQWQHHGELIRCNIHLWI